MEERRLYIRFGLHRDRKMLRLLKDEYAGIVLPAHILAYSANATIAAIRYVNKPYFIDPMTYIYGEGFLDDYKVYKKSDDNSHLKPSIIKLTQDLSLEDYFPEVEAKPLRISSFDSGLVTKIVEGNLNLQLNKVNTGLATSTPKLDALLAEIGQPPSSPSGNYPPPQFITTPYFFIPQEHTEEWLKINLKLAKQTKKLAPAGHEVWPIVLSYVDLLNDSLLEQYKDFDGLIVWVEDLEEGRPFAGTEQIRKLSVYSEFLKAAKGRGIKIINLYGSYYSAILLKLGLTAFCNGPLYGEYKSSSASLGGVPPVRVYIPSLHRFYIYSQASELLRLYPALFDGFPAKSKALFGSIPEIAKILGDVTLAQQHFIYSRNQEIKKVLENDIGALIEGLKTSFESVGPFTEEPLKTKEPLQLKAWHEALKSET